MEGASAHAYSKEFCVCCKGTTSCGQKDTCPIGGLCVKQWLDPVPGMQGFALVPNISVVRDMVLIKDTWETFGVTSDFCLCVASMCRKILILVLWPLCMLCRNNYCTLHVERGCFRLTYAVIRHNRVAVVTLFPILNDPISTHTANLNTVIHRVERGELDKKSTLKLPCRNTSSRAQQIEVMDCGRWVPHMFPYPTMQWETEFFVQNLIQSPVEKNKDPVTDFNGT